MNPRFLPHIGECLAAKANQPLEQVEALDITIIIT
jgi:hypothetical protein